MNLWSVFQSIKNGEKQYKHHCLSTVCVPVPMNNFGQRRYDDWIFYYKGWSINQQNDEIVDINSVEKNSSGKELVCTDAKDTTKNDDVAETKESNTNTKEYDEFFDT